MTVQSDLDLAFEIIKKGVYHPMDLPMLWRYKLGIFSLFCIMPTLDVVLVMMDGSNSGKELHHWRIEDPKTVLLLEDAVRRSGVSSYYLRAVRFDDDGLDVSGTPFVQLTIEDMHRAPWYLDIPGPARLTVPGARPVVVSEHNKLELETWAKTKGAMLRVRINRGGQTAHLLQRFLYD